jgi:sugar lactone lactonase YvrE
MRFCRILLALELSLLPLHAQVGRTGIITTIAGGSSGFSGDGGPAISAQFAGPSALAVDRAGSIYVADSLNGRIRKISTDGIVTTVAGSTQGFKGDGGPATSAQLLIPQALCIDQEGSLFIGDGPRVRKIDSSGVIRTVAGVEPEWYVLPGSGAQGVQATTVALDTVWAVATDSRGNLFFTEATNRVRKVDPAGIITTLPVSNRIQAPYGLTVDSADNLYVTNSVYGKIFRVAPDGTISDIAGNGQFFSDVVDGGPASQALLGMPHQLAADGSGNLFVTDTSGGRIRKIAKDGTITTVAGPGSILRSDDEGKPASEAYLAYPVGVAIDPDGNVIVVDQDRIRKVSYQ